MTAKKLKAARHKAGLSQVKAAEVCGVSPRSWQYYEAGTITPRRPMFEYYVAQLNKSLAQAQDLR